MRLVAARVRFRGPRRRAGRAGADTFVRLARRRTAGREDRARKRRPETREDTQAAERSHGNHAGGRPSYCAATAAARAKSVDPRGDSPHHERALVERASPSAEERPRKAKEPDDGERDAAPARGAASALMTPPPLPEKAERAEKGEKGEKAEKSEKADRGERAERAEKTDRPEAVAKKDDGTKGAGDILGDGPAPSIPPPPAAGPWRSYKEIIAFLASRIVEAQKPIRVLQSLRWENSVEEQFLKTRGRELPKVDPGYYEAARPRLRSARQERGVRGDRARHRPRARRGGRDRQHHGVDGHRVPRRRAHAVAAREAALLRLLAEAVRLAEGQVPRRKVDGARPRPRDVRDPHERRRQAPRADASSATSRAPTPWPSSTPASRATSAARRSRCRPTTRSSRTRPRGATTSRCGRGRGSRRATSTSSRSTRAGSTSRRR